jgi:hypothetical protein
VHDNIQSTPRQTRLNHDRLFDISVISELEVALETYLNSEISGRKNANIIKFIGQIASKQKETINSPVSINKRSPAHILPLQFSVTDIADATRKVADPSEFFTFCHHGRFYRCPIMTAVLVSRKIVALLESDPPLREYHIATEPAASDLEAFFTGLSRGELALDFRDPIGFAHFGGELEILALVSPVVASFARTIDPAFQAGGDVETAIDFCAQNLFAAGTRVCSLPAFLLARIFSSPALPTTDPNGLARLMMALILGNPSSIVSSLSLCPRRSWAWSLIASLIWPRSLGSWLGGRAIFFSGSEIRLSIE